MILAIETSAATCSVGFYRDQHILAEFESDAAMKHSELVGSFVEKGLKELGDNVHLVVVAIGPGSFTGLRIGLSYAKGFCFGKSIPIVGVSNHQILAVQGNTDGQRYSIIDAHRQEVYLAEHKLNETAEINSHKITAIKNIANEIPIGAEIIYLAKTIPVEVEQEILKKSINIKHEKYKPSILAELGNRIFKKKGSDDPEKLEPMYIRPFAGVK